MASAAIVVAAWVVCAISYATDGGGSYNGGLFTLFGVGAVALTSAAAIAIGQAWNGTRAIVVVAPALSVLAVASVLWLALAFRMRG